MEAKKTIERMNQEYLQILNSREYKLGSMISGVCDGIRTFNRKKVCKNLKLLWQGVRIQKYSSKKERYKTVENGENIGKVAVYMALFGGYDEIYEPIVKEDNCDYFIFTDQDLGEDSAWKKIKLSVEESKAIENLTNPEKNRYFKMVGYSRFQEYEYSIYLDTNLEIYGKLAELSAYARNQFGLALYNHPARDCIYNEAKACVILGKAKKKNVKKQMKLYKNAGMPAHYGMCECNVIVRENKNQKCMELMQEWWGEFLKSEAKRDQLLFPYIFWKNNICLEEIGCLGENIDCDGRFRRRLHMV